MSFYLKEAVVRRKDIVDRLIKLGDSLEILSNPEFSRNSEDASGILLSYKNLLDTHLPSSKYSKYEDVFYNWAINHEGHRFDDLKTVVALFEDEYVGKLRSIDKSPQIFSTSLANSLTLVDLYEMIDLIEEKQRYSTKNIKDSDDTKYEAIGVYPLHVDFSKGNNLSNFILEFIEGEHELMIVKPTSTNGSIFWSQACFVNDAGEEGIEAAHDYFSRLDSEGILDDSDLGKLIRKEKRHRNTVTWCTSTANPAGNMFLGYTAGTNTHLYYSFNPLKDKTDELRRFCTGLTYNVNRQTNEQEGSYVKIENRENVSDSSLVDATNSYFDLENAIQEWKKYSPSILKNINKDLIQNPQTEARADMIKQTFAGFLEKCKSLPVMQSISYKLSTSRFISTIRNGDSILKENKDLTLLKEYFSKENLYINSTLFSSKIKKINSLWLDFLKEKETLSINCNVAIEAYSPLENSSLTAGDMLEGILNYTTNIYCTSLFNTFDSLIGIDLDYSDPGSFLEKYNLMHNKDYKKHPKAEGYGYQDPDDDFALTFEDEKIKPINELQVLNKKLSVLEETINKSSLALFDFIENGLENFSKEEILDYALADVAYTELRFSYGFKEDLGSKLDNYENVKRMLGGGDMGLNHVECIRIITSVSSMNFENFKNKFLVNANFRSNFNQSITSEENFDWGSYGNLTNPYNLVQTILDNIGRQQNFLSTKFQERNVNNLVSNIILKSANNKKQNIEDNFSYYYKVLFANIDKLFENPDFLQIYKLNLSRYLEAIEDFLIVSQNKSYSMSDISYKVDYSTNLNIQDLKNLYIDFFAFYDNHHKRNIKSISSSLNDKNLLIEEDDLRSYNKKNITKESFIRNYDSFINYLVSKEAVKKASRKIPKESLSNTFKKNNIYWEIIFGYGFESFYNEIKVFAKEIKKISDEDLYENFKYQTVGLGHDDTSKKDYDYIELPLLKSRIKKLFENFFIHNQDSEYLEQEGGAGQKNYSEFLKSFELVPNEVIVTSKYHLPWEIIV